MRLLKELIQLYHAKENSLQKQYEQGDFLTYYIQELSHNYFAPSLQLKAHLNALQARMYEPMRIAIVGQFSAGKSTFLNALLGKEVLPTGITPITSNICHIRYGEEFRFDILYRNGQKEALSPQSFKESQKISDEIAEITLYAPLMLLREISFLDTPGFNSQNACDSAITTEILDKVDGIIWLMLIDNAGKQSELEILEQHIKKYATKTLCVLNQKDKLDSPIEVETSLQYVRESFGQYFSDTVAISARLALQAQDNTRLVERELTNLLQSFTSKTYKNRQISKEELSARFHQCKNRIDSLWSDEAKRAKLYEDSNFASVLAFLQEKLYLQSREVKKQNAKTQIAETIDTIISQYEYFHNIYKKLDDIFVHYGESLEANLRIIKEKQRHELRIIAEDLHYHIENLAEIFLKNIKKSAIHHTRKPLKVLKFTIAKSDERATLEIHHDGIYQELFLGDSRNRKFFNTLQSKIKRIASKMYNDFQTLQESLHDDVGEWQEIHESLYKKDPLHFDELYIQLSHFIAHIHEYIMKDFDTNLNTMHSFINTELNALTLVFDKAHNSNLLTLAIFRLKEHLEKIAHRHLSAPSEFDIDYPSLEEIRTIVEESLALEDYLHRIEGENTTANKAYQKFFTNTYELIANKRSMLAGYLAKFNEHLRRLKTLQENLAILAICEADQKAASRGIETHQSLALPCMK